MKKKVLMALMSVVLFLLLLVAIPLKSISAPALKLPKVVSINTYRGKLFYRLLEQAVETPPVPYSTIIKKINGLKLGKHNP